MKISGIVVANPAQYDMTQYSIHISNQTQSGYQSYFVGTSVGVTVYTGMRLKITWGNLTMSEMGVLTSAWRTLIEAYDTISVPDLGISYGGESDTCFATVDPEEPMLSRRFSQGWIGNEGPIYFDAAATFMTKPEEISLP